MRIKVLNDGVDDAVVQGIHADQGVECGGRLKAGRYTWAAPTSPHHGASAQ